MASGWCHQLEKVKRYLLGAKHGREEVPCSQINGQRNERLAICQIKQTSQSFPFIIWSLVKLWKSILINNSQILKQKSIKCTYFFKRCPEFASKVTVWQISIKFIGLRWCDCVLIWRINKRYMNLYLCNPVQKGQCISHSNFLRSLDLNESDSSRKNLIT